MIASLLAGLRRGRRGFWTVSLFALVILLSACGLLALAAVDRVPRLTPDQQRRAVTKIINHHSFSPPLLRQYYGDGEIPHWTMSGTTVITDHYVRLTPDMQSQTGHFWNTEPLDMDAFEVVVGFRVFRKMGGLGADGFALWVANQPRFDGNVFGRPANFDGFGILFDSYDNDNRRNNPMVSLVANDGSSTKALNPEMDFMGQTLGNCIFDFRNIHAPSMGTARVTYNKGTISLYFSRTSEQNEEHCFTVHNVAMPKGKAYLAFSAQTGGVSEVHDIVFVHLSPLESVEYDHDVQEPVGTVAAEAEPQLYDNDAMNNRKPAEEATLPPEPEQTQQQQQEQQQQQQTQQTQQPNTADIEAQIRAETERRVAELERQRLEAELERQRLEAERDRLRLEAEVQRRENELRQKQQQQQQQQQQQPLDPVAQERQRIAELERQLADLKRRESRRPAQPANDDDDDWEDEDAYEKEQDNQPRRRRMRRARTPGRRNVDENY